jgi:nitrate/nitrite-specific signal transduction histidine kinase
MQGLVLRFHSMTKRLPADDDTRRGLEKILDQADVLIADGREEVLNLRSQPPTSDDVVEALSDFGLSLQETFGPAFAMNMRGKPRVLVAQAWRELYSIAREGLFNAYRHAHARHVEIEIVYGPDAFSLFVRDDGAGIDAGVLAKGGKEGHWGLRSMRERAASLGGTVELRNRTSGGAEVALRIPADNAYMC